MARDRRGRSAPPAALGDLVDRFASEIAPETPVSGIQAAWRQVVGDAVAEVTRVVGEREGVVSVECRDAVWAEELTLMEPDIRTRLNEVLTEPVTAVRFAAVTMDS